MANAGLLKRLGRMLTEDLDEIEDDRIQRECRAPGAQRAVDCVRGDEATMVGELRSVETCARSSKSGVQAEFFDGTDTVVLKWMGRNRIPGIEAGRRLTVRGRIAVADGVKTMYNPYYELHAADD
ncbi:OB-fold nucleic acid binding domain-containing protein [Gordonia sp. (in: high G+C Gram-positive bacteria)]|uniref:OB-fold nucleic acid binding domain-containing protein n=1 Tax=Gordonia sp. (in: high G+C Gram-positive bacteria) TaxID=84139 RepID=UPI0016987544|nr:OB-fold nucleic acid binding domain-containing protein [Gordonia sp. (in: high G+C Gram-positive bacteria)]NLG48333.1 OB-fold nucleic acid binding domain-containing protein [Gordonia sp. (in: high G+C Gram-positive bacteria)]